MLANTFWADVHAATLVLLLLGGIGFGAALAFVVSPAGRPAARRRRAGGFSRALAARAEQYGER